MGDNKMDSMNKLISLFRDNVHICGIGIEDEYYYKRDVHHMGQNEIKWTKIYVKRSTFYNLFLHVFMWCHFNDVLIMASCV
jgi:hypothetical protein